MVYREVCAVMRKGKKVECNATQSMSEKDKKVLILFQVFVDSTLDDVVRGNQIMMNESVPLSSFARCSVRFCLLVGMFVYYEQVQMTMCFMFVFCESFGERARNNNKLDIFFSLLCYACVQ
jgi:hypothetical protein